MNIPIAKPVMGDREKQAVLAVLDSGHIVQGEEVEKFEAAFADYHGARYATAVNNGTSALIASMMAHRIQPGDEVLVPSFTFFATAAAVLSVGAVPVFVDIDPDTFCMSPGAARAAITPHTVGIIPVHLYGHPAEMLEFEKICAAHGLVLFEDAAQAHGARIGDRHIGTFGTACFSFYPSKNMTTSEGGMVLTNDDEVCRQLRMIRNQGMNQQYCHEVLGYNLRMTNIQAAIGNVQLESLSQWTQERISNADYFNQHLKHVQVPTTLTGYTHVFHQYTIRVPASIRNQLVDQLNKRGVGARVYYPTPIHQQPVIRELYHVELPVTEKIAGEVISLPVHPQLTSEERQYIVDVVNTLCQTETNAMETAL